MLLLVEGLMFLAGVWAIVTATLPALALLFRGPDYDLEGSGVRLPGLILLLLPPSAHDLMVALSLAACPAAHPVAAESGCVSWRRVPGKDAARYNPILYAAGRTR
jgi:hypothetical protein